jgi:hypothetical protein
MQAAVDEAGRVVKKQKLCSQKVDDSIEQLIQLVTASKQQLQTDTGNAPEVLQHLRKQIDDLAIAKTITGSTKDLHKSVASLDKVRITRYDPPMSNASLTGCFRPWTKRLTAILMCAKSCAPTYSSTGPQSTRWGPCGHDCRCQPSPSTQHVGINTTLCQLSVGTCRGNCCSPCR